MQGKMTFIKVELKKFASIPFLKGVGAIFLCGNSFFKGIMNSIFYIDRRKIK